MPIRVSTLAAIVVLAGFARAEPAGLTSDERARIDTEIKELGQRIDALKEKAEHSPASAPVRLHADAEVFRKAVIWTLRYEPKLQPADVALVQKALKRCRERVEALEAGNAPWQDRPGKFVRGFRSNIDGSVQPYGVVVPRSYTPPDPKAPRVDIVLHGSMKPTGITELRFLMRFDEGDKPAAAPDQDFIEVHPFGRCENCYSWAGERDVFEALNDATQRYRTNYGEVVLRGMSMGASGTWHLGLKHPDRFVALGPYCGYVDTHEFSRTPMPNFVPVGPLPPYQEAALHLLDSVDYAANAGMVPVVACMGETDPFFQAHVLMAKAMEKEGLELTNLISPGTGHVIDPVTHKEQMRRIAEFANREPDAVPKHVRFVTWTLKYNRCRWVTIEGLEEHYKRAEIDATLSPEVLEIKEPRNVTRFKIDSAPLDRTLAVRIGTTKFDLGDDRPRKAWVFAKKDGRWARLVGDEAKEIHGKAPDLQGPIDDAFTGPFLCVRGTGKPWNPAVQAWADASLKRFANEWAKYFRGDLPVKDDKDVTEADLGRCHLILFGDPGSNSLIARVLPKLPVEWTKGRLVMGGQSYPAATHAPVLIQSTPLKDGEGNYVVINSGHTFHEKELSTLNYLQFPRLGDWAVMKVGDPPADLSQEQPVRAGFFDEKWRFK